MSQKDVKSLGAPTLVCAQSRGRTSALEVALAAFVIVCTEHAAAVSWPRQLGLMAYIVLQATWLPGLS